VLPTLLITASAAIVLILGTIHLIYTFASNKFVPRDSSLAEQMSRTSPIISKQTTMWRAWIGFNASHSLGTMLFGVLYGHLAVFHLEMLTQSLFLFSVGLIFLSSFLVLARLYWFSIPFFGIISSLVLYMAGFAVARA